MKKSFSVRQIALNSVLIAICTVLAGLSVNLGGNFKITFESLPVHIGALLFGPINGMLIGGIATFIYQVLLSGYGITATTLLWILPYVVCGLIDGLCALRSQHGRKRLILTILLSELTITVLNTFALYVDSRLYGYYSPVFVFGTLAARILMCTLKAITYGTVIPELLKAIKKPAEQGFI